MLYALHGRPFDVEEVDSLRNMPFTISELYYDIRSLASSHEKGPRFREGLHFVAGTGFEPATSGL